MPRRMMKRDLIGRTLAVYYGSVDTYQSYRFVSESYVKYINRRDGYEAESRTSWDLHGDTIKISGRRYRIDGNKLLNVDK